MACDWSCDKCTLVNPPSADTCEACGMTRPASCPASPTRGQDWECHMCTFLNQRSSAVCYACDSVKEETAVVTPAPAPVPADHWSCSACTYQNSNRRSSCQVCVHFSCSFVIITRIIVGCSKSINAMLCISFVLTF